MALYILSWIGIIPIFALFYTLMPDRYKAKLPFHREEVKTPLADKYLSDGYVFISTKIVDPGTQIRFPYLSKEDEENERLIEQAMQDEENRKIYSKVIKQDGTPCQSMQEYEDECTISRVQSFLNTKERIPLELAKQIKSMNFSQRQAVYMEMHKRGMQTSLGSLMDKYVYGARAAQPIDNSHYFKGDRQEVKLLEGEALRPKLIGSGMQLTWVDDEKKEYHYIDFKGDKIVISEEELIKNNPIIKYRYD